MYMTNEKWEQNNQDYLKESYEETGFTAGGYAVRKLICGLHHHLHQEILSQLLVRQCSSRSSRLNSANTFMYWTGHCIWMKAHRISMSVMCSTARTSTVRLLLSRKRH